MTEPSAKTMAFDLKTKRFLPAAEVDVIPAADPSGRPQRKIRPGTLAVLVLRPTQKP